MKKQIFTLTTILLAFVLSGCIPGALYSFKSGDSSQPVGAQSESHGEEQSLPALRYLNSIEIGRNRSNLLQEYVYQVLPQTVLDYEKEIIAFIDAGNLNQLEMNIRADWAFLVDIFLTDQFTDEENEYARLGKEQYFELLDRNRIAYDLGHDHIIEVTLEEFGTEAWVVLIEMRNLEDEYWLTPFVAIAYQEDIGLKYFILYLSHKSSFGEVREYTFCRINAPFDDELLGIVDANREAFLDAICDVMGIADR